MKNETPRYHVPLLAYGRPTRLHEAGHFGGVRLSPRRLPPLAGRSSRTLPESFRRVVHEKQAPHPALLSKGRRIPDTPPESAPTPTRSCVFLSLERAHLGRLFVVDQ